MGIPLTDNPAFVSLQGWWNQRSIGQNLGGAVVAGVRDQRSIGNGRTPAVSGALLVVRDAEGAVRHPACSASCEDSLAGGVLA
jgi:hypothetical protein